MRTCLPFWFCVTSIAGVGFLLYQRRGKCLRENPLRLPYPPGPPPWPLVGNLFDLARRDEVEKYLVLAKKYGELVFLSAFGKNILLVNSFQASNELFDKRSANYSDRTHSPMLHELMGWEWTIGHMPYGEQWKVHRRMFHRQFHQNISPIHWPIQRKEARALLGRLLHSPTDLFEHLRHHAASVIMKVTYGIDLAPKNDRYIVIAEQALAGMAEAANPGAFLVDLLPILKFIPEWMPGAGFKQKARKWKDAVYEMRDAPYESTLRAIKEGRGSPCFVSNLAAELERDAKSSEEFEEQMEIVKRAAGMSYAAGTESIMSALSSFILAMVLHPEVQARAQEELDRVVGRGRLPDFGDRKDLVYIGAVVKEIFRWCPVAPLGLPHMVTRADEYNGYFIPAGTTIIGNSWAILHDPTIFPAPSKFDPERFLSRPKRTTERMVPEFGPHDSFSPSDPLSVTFGYGRRVCPGRYMADAQIWISVACILAAFDIGCGTTDTKTTKVKPKARFSSGFIRYPLPYAFEIRPRGKYVWALVEQTSDESGNY